MRRCAARHAAVVVLWACSGVPNLVEPLIVLVLVLVLLVPMPLLLLQAQSSCASLLLLVLAPILPAVWVSYMQLWLLVASSL